MEMIEMVVLRREAIPLSLHEIRIWRSCFVEV